MIQRGANNLPFEVPRTISSPSSIHFSQLGFGGAWIAAKRIQESLQSVGLVAEINSKFDYELNYPGIFQKSLNKVDDLLSNVSSTLTTTSYFRSANNANWYRKLYKNYGYFDVWNLHWLPGIPSSSLEMLLKKRKIVWTLHDVNPFTGICHYAGECEGFRENCSDCPQAAKRIQRLASYALLRKSKIYESPAKLVFVAPSKWIESKFLESSIGSKFEIRHIPNPIPFESTDKRNIETRGKTTITILGKNYEKTKNSNISLHAMIEMIRRYPTHTFCIQVLGDEYEELKPYGQTSLSINSSPFEVKEFLLRSDILIYPSRQDNLPSLVLEAQAAGNVVVAFSRGGIPESISNGKTGFLVPESVLDIVEIACKLIDNPEILRRMQKAAPEFVYNQFSSQIIGEKYKSLYQELTSEE
jgi:glycosyltransferase involved in cell wall biosynthesis